MDGNLNTTSHRLYTHIKPYQTRIIRLHGRAKDEESPVTCDVIVASLIDSHFEGLVLEGLLDEEEEEEGSDDFVQYDALSWAWGPAGAREKEIVCNGVNLSVLEDLHIAIRELQPPQPGGIRYLWIDRICIAQHDKKEKSFQVANMYLIYRKARTVLAWLGPEHEHTRLAVQAVLCRPADSSNTQSMCDEEFWKVHAGLHNASTRSWFQRVWVQQEVFAARELHLRCGQLAIPMSELYHSPRARLTGSSAATEGKREKAGFFFRRKNPKPDTPVRDPAMDMAVDGLERLWQSKLYCFRTFAKSGLPPPDFVETLLRTSQMEVSDARDRIYGILQMTGFPSRAVSIADWIRMRQTEVFIPIDYTAPLHDLLCAVTWVLLMKCGLSMLLKFKAFYAISDTPSEQSLPSWVIDWRLASSFLEESTLPKVKLDNPWDYTSSSRLRSRPSPSAHHQFCSDNCQASIAVNKIIVRGKVLSGLIVEANGTCIRRRRKVLWDTKVVLHANDLIVHITAFVWTYAASAGDPVNVDHGAWLLRPVENEEYKLLACLSNQEDEESVHSPYSHWNQSRGVLLPKSRGITALSDDAPAMDRCRAFTATTVDPEDFSWRKLFDQWTIGANERFFTIV